MSLSINRLTLSTPTRCLVNELSLSVNTGDRWVIIGPNGAGKSSLLKASVGLTAHPEVTLNRKPFMTMNQKIERNALGFYHNKA